MECDRKRCFKELKENILNLSKNCNTSCLKSFDKRKHISVCEKKKKYLLHNDQEHTMAVFHVDGEMIQSNDAIKCDNLILDLTNMTAIFIELKGTDLAHALVQINSTIDMMKNDVAEYSKFARIVTSNRTNVPNIKANPNYIKLYRKANVKIGATIIEEDVSSLS